MEVTQPMQRKKGPLMTGCGVLFGVCCCFSKVISSAVWRLSLPMSLTVSWGSIVGTDFGEENLCFAVFG